MAEDQPQGRNKRQRVVVACEPCRARKTKCDGRPPVCGPCHRRGQGPDVCEWVHSLFPNDGYQQENEYIRHLESRLQEMEQWRQQQQQPSEAATSKSTSRPPRAVLNSPNVSPEAGHKDPAMAATGNAVVATAAATPPRDTGQEAIKSLEPPMPAVLGPTSEGSLKETYRWSSSAASFFSHVHRMTSEKHARSDNTENRVALYPTADREDHDTSHYVLPPRKMADRHLETYWKHVHTLFPVIARKVTMAEYHTLWTADGTMPHEQSFHCLFNIMLALASLVQTTGTAPQERAASAKVFYQRARGLFDHNNAATVRNVQICLLFGLYLQSTDELHDCWMHVGLAIRIAQGIGLHLSQTSACHFHSRERALFRRVWYGCVMMDRTLAMMTGRPCTIHRTEALAVPRPAAVEGEVFPSDSYPRGPDSSNPTKVEPSIVHFFNSTLTLYDILYDILRAFYTETCKAPELLREAYDLYFASSSPSSVTSLDERLSAWESAQPYFLRMQSYSSDQSITDLFRQAVLLRQRFLHVRILSLRPALSALIVHHEREHTKDTDSLRTAVVTAAFVQSSVSCFRAAQEAITIVSKRDPDATSVFHPSSWWEDILFVYTAATCVLIPRLRLSLFPDITHTDISEAWQKAISVLRKFTAYTPSVAGMVSKLESLYNSVSLRTSDNCKSGSHQLETGAQPMTGDTSFLDFDNMTSIGAAFPDFATMTAGAMDSNNDTLPLFGDDDSWLDLSPFHC